MWFIRVRKTNYYEEELEEVSTVCEVRDNDIDHEQKLRKKSLR
ncbi:hypothetical protein ACFL0W_04325 [Nanoarchaeota archaeon]